MQARLSRASVLCGIMVTGSHQRRDESGPELLSMMNWAAHFRLYSELEALAYAALNAGVYLQSDSPIGHRVFLAGLEDILDKAVDEHDFAAVLDTLQDAANWLLKAVSKQELFDLRLKIRRQMVLSPLRKVFSANSEVAVPSRVADLDMDKYWTLLDGTFPLETTRRASLSAERGDSLASPGLRENSYERVVEAKERKQLLDVQDETRPGGGADIHKVLYLLKTYSREGFTAEVREFTRRVEARLLEPPEPLSEDLDGGGTPSGALGNDPRLLASAPAHIQRRLGDWTRTSALVSNEAEREATEVKLRAHAQILRYTLEAGQRGCPGGRQEGERKGEGAEMGSEEEEAEAEAAEEEGMAEGRRRGSSSNQGMDARHLAKNLRRSTKVLREGLSQRGLLKIRGTVEGGEGMSGAELAPGHKKRLYDATRAGRSITFEDSQYVGDDSDEEGQRAREREKSGNTAAATQSRQLARENRLAKASAAAAARLAERSNAFHQRGEHAQNQVPFPLKTRNPGEEHPEEDGEKEAEQQEEGGKRTGEATGAPCGDTVLEADETRQGQGRGRGTKDRGGERKRTVASKRKLRLAIDNSGRSKRRQPKTHRTSWSQEEVGDLKRAVLHDGMKGRWADILNSPSYTHLDFNLRTSVDLKDKWRGLERKAASKGLTVAEVD